jgi:S-adenosylmethionine decarboxylase
MNSLGTHLLVDMFGVDPVLLADHEYLAALFGEAIYFSKMTPLETVAKKFPAIEGNPYGGATVISILAESHLSIHTYPEMGTAMVDVFTCGDKAKPEIAAEILIDALNPVAHNIIKVPRGKQ